MTHRIYTKRPGGPPLPRTASRWRRARSQQVHRSPSGARAPTRRPLARALLLVLPVTLAAYFAACTQLPEGVQKMRVTGAWMPGVMHTYGWALVDAQAYKSPGEVTRGDVIVYRKAFGQTYILCVARALGLPGDEVEVSDLDVFIERRRLKRSDADIGEKRKVYTESVGDESYRVIYNAEIRGSDRPDLDFRVPAAQLFVLGDLRDYRKPTNSCDPSGNSTVSFTEVIGRFIARS